MTTDKLKAAFAETTLAAKLLDEFSVLSHKRKKVKPVTKASVAAGSFFDTEYLTIFDYFSPIGFDLRVTSGTERIPATVREFISTMLNRQELWHQNIRHEYAASSLLHHIKSRKSKKTIKDFLSKIGV
jgi:hypothetical protein